MIKIVCLMNRKPGMTMEAFKRYYEDRHVPLINRLMPYWQEYRRSFAIEGTEYRTGHLDDDRSADRPFDVMMEMSFASGPMYQKMLATLADPEASRLITEDEEQFFDRASIRVFLVEEHRSAR